MISEENLKIHKQAKCVLCFPQVEIDLQICFVLKQIIIEMKSLLQVLKQTQINDSKPNSFVLLMKSVFVDIESVTAQTFDCTHEQLKKLIQKKIQCNQKQLLKISQQIFATITKRKYQLQVIKNILKNIPKSIEKICNPNDIHSQLQQKCQSQELQNYEQQEKDQTNKVKQQNQGKNQKNQGIKNEQQIQNRQIQQEQSQNHQHRYQFIQHSPFNPYGYSLYAPNFPYPYFYNPNNQQ